MKRNLTKKNSQWGRYSFLIVFLLWSSWAAAQQTISGVVTDSKGQPVSGASVQIKGTTTGVAANIDGKYTIKASAKAILTFKSIGFESRDVVVGNSSTINITLD